MRWCVHSQRALYHSEWVDFWLEVVEIEDGKRLEHHVLRMPRHSVVMDERVLLLLRRRFITDTWRWEAPAGWIDQGAAPIKAGRQELEQKTGWSPGPLTQLCTHYDVPGIADSNFTLFRTDGARHLEDRGDASEAARAERIPASKMASPVALAFPPVAGL